MPPVALGEVGLLAELEVERELLLGQLKLLDHALLDEVEQEEQPLGGVALDLAVHADVLQCVEQVLVLALLLAQTADDEVDEVLEQLGTVVPHLAARQLEQQLQTLQRLLLLHQTVHVRNQEAQRHRVEQVQQRYHLSQVLELTKV